MTVRRCADCSLIYLHPMMAKDEEHTFYSNYDKHLQNRAVTPTDTPAILFETTSPDALERVQSIGRYLAPSMRLVEIGASVGAFCAAVKDSVAGVVGVEPSPTHRAYLTTLDVPAVPYLDDLDQNEKFDAAAFFHVLEHMRRPVEFLQDVSKLLNPDAYIFVEVPNVQDALLTLYNCQAFMDFYYQPMHCVYFSPETLQRAFHSAGFSTVELIAKQRYDLSNHMVWLQHGKPGGVRRFNSVFNPELDAAYASSLKEHWLCDTIFGVFKRE